MKKYLLLLFLPLLVVISACDKDDPEPEMPYDKVVPGKFNSYTSKVFNCDCGKIYVVYFKKPNQTDPSVNDSGLMDKYFPDGESNDWIVKIIDGETTVNYPMTIYYYGGVIELYCKWSCECGNSFFERRESYQR